MKLNFVLIVSIAGLLSPNVAHAVEFPIAKLTVVVQDEMGQPVSNARVGLNGTMREKADEVAKGITSADGFFSAEVATNGEVGIGARKDGYYDTVGLTHNFRNVKGSLENAFATGRWEPWDVHISAILKPITNPIPMYARTVSRGVPTESNTLALDLFAGDYLPPHGSGKHADMTFELRNVQRERNDYDYNLIVRFARQFDGIQPFSVERYRVGSRLRSAHEAPADGFLPEWTVFRSRRPGQPQKTNYDPDTHAFFFRVRTIVDASGKIQSANYGKIYGDFMDFTYYLNPTPNDRNIEFDPKRNLFTNLKDEEKVSEP